MTCLCTCKVLQIFTGNIHPADSCLVYETLGIKVPKVMFLSDFGNIEFIRIHELLIEVARMHLKGDFRQKCLYWGLRNMNWRRHP